jgi:sigma-B regulation protein RsbU (phosphoserine phosphatase)
MFAQSRFDVHELELGKEDRLFLFTDGLTEALNQAEEEFGDEAVSSGIVGGWGATAEANINASLRALEDFTNGTPRVDDLTMLVVRRTGEVGR